MQHISSPKIFIALVRAISNDPQTSLVYLAGTIEAMFPITKPHTIAVGFIAFLAATFGVVCSTFCIPAGLTTDCHHCKVYHLHPMHTHHWHTSHTCFISLVNFISFGGCATVIIIIATVIIIIVVVALGASLFVARLACHCHCSHF